VISDALGDIAVVAAGLRRDADAAGTIQAFAHVPQKSVALISVNEASPCRRTDARPAPEVQSKGEQDYGSFGRQPSIF
jgi:hypothetical protein